MSEGVAMVEVEQKLFEEVKAQHARVAESRSAYEGAKSRAKYCKEALEADQTTLESLIRRLTAPAEDLPLFQNQSEAIEAATSDPVVMKLAERLLHHGHDVNLLIVAGYTEEERRQAQAYCDVLDANEAEIQRVYGTEEPASVTAVDVPAFLIWQPPSVIELADMLARLKTAGMDLGDNQSGFNHAEWSEATHWVELVEQITAQRGEHLVADDLPAAPEWLFSRAAHVASPLEIGRPVNEQQAEADDVIDEPQPENLPPPARGKRRRSAEQASV